MTNKNEILIQTQQGLRIFEFYIPEIKVKGVHKNFKSLFRDDGENPDANIFLNKRTNVWNYRDFVTGETLNPFDFVMKKENCDFPSALRKIVTNICPYISKEVKPNPILKNTISDLQLTSCNDFNYWEQYIHDKIKIIEYASMFNLISVKECVYKKNGKTVKISASNTSPIFAFKIDDNCYKIYQPLAKQKSQKHWWLGTKPDWYRNVFGINLLSNNADKVLIVEGYKDAFVANANGISAVGVDNAATNINSSAIEEIQSKCNQVFICYDNDTAGKKGSSKVSKQYGIPILNIPKEFTAPNGKDISDFFLNGNSANKLMSLMLENNQINNQTTLPKLSKLEQIEKIINENFSIRYNVITNSIECKSINQNNSEFDVLNENNIFRFLQHQNKNISMNKLISLLKSDFVESYNPFSAYFESLPEWKGCSDPDYIGQLCNYLPTTESERFSIQFRKSLVRTVACSLAPDIVNKQALIIVHEAQNSGKTTFIRWLCPPFLSDYIAENISIDKDSLIALCENFIINMDELATLSKAEINSLKSLLSKKDVKIRRPYDRVPTKSIRRASFFGSTNKVEFLTDETGNVRWLCFELADKLNWNYKEDINIDDVWRQAYKLYKNKFDFELTQKELVENEIANQQFIVSTSELQIIQKHFIPGTSKDNAEFATATDISNLIKEIYPGISVTPQNIGKALKILGFKKVSKRMKELDFPIKGYYIIKK